MPSLGRYVDHTMQDYGDALRLTLTVAFHAGGVRATCAISGVVDLQNLLDTTLVLNSQTSTLTLSLHRRLPRRQSCLTLLATSLEREREIKAEKERKKLLAIEATLASRARRSLKICKTIGKIYSTHWSCEGRSSIRVLPAQLKP